MFRSTAFVVVFAILAGACSGLTSWQRDDAVEMCTDYQVGRGVPQQSATELCVGVVEVASEAGCDLGETIRYVAARLGTRPYAIRDELIFGFPARAENPQAVLREC